MSLDILFINPNERKQVYQNLAIDLSGIEPPTFTLLVAQYLRNKGLSVAMIDQGPFALAPEKIAEEVEYLNPTLVCMYVYGYQPSASTQNMPAARRICQAIKNLNPARKIMMSGTHSAALPKRTLLEEPVDFVCDREGFETPYLLLQSLYHKSRDESNLGRDVPDLWWKNFSKDTESHFSHRGALLTNEQLDSIGAPAWDLVEHNGKLDHYRAHNWHNFSTNSERFPYASLYSSLGCSFRCNFCCINATFGDMLSGPRPYRLFSPHNTVNQIETLVKKYGVRNIKFVDEMFVLNKKHVLGICDEIMKRGLNNEINIWAYARVDQTGDEFLKPLKDAGFNWLALGIESGSKHVRDGANKKYTNDDIVDVVRRIQNAGINVIGNYIFGLPDDNLESMQNTYDMAVELNCEFANFYATQAYPGSPLYSMAVKEGWKLPSSWEGYSQHGYETLPLRTEFCTNAEILKFRDESHIKYFSRQEYQSMVLSKFGTRAVSEINQMLSLGRPKRKILGD